MKSITDHLRNRHKISATFFYASLIILLTITVTSCQHNHDHDFNRNEVVYVETNDYHANQNAILAYTHKADGTLEQIPGSPFSTNGSGLSNTGQILGPNDKETPEIIYNDKFLLAVNGGSNTIAVFNINSDGSLQQVPGSPFPSGGQTPVSLATSGNYLYVVNKSQDPIHEITAAPNYTTFTIGSDGTLTAVAGSKFETAPGVSPSQALVSTDHKFIFGTDFLGFMASPALGTLRSFARNNDGTFAPVANTPYSLPAGDGGALGLWQHPHADVLYVGFPVAGKVGVYSINSANGQLTYHSDLAGGAATCWIRVSKDGKYMYTLNSAENTISVFNTTVALSPVFVQKFTLKNSGPLYPGPMPGVMFTTSEDFHLSFSKSEKFLYVVSQHTNVDFTIGNFNYLHTLTVNQDGTLTEPGEPNQLPVGADVRPEGVAVY